MKRLLSALALFFVCATVSAQTIYQGSPNQNVLYKGVVGADSGLFIKPVADLGAGRFAGHIRCKTDGTCYIWDGTTWKGLGGGGSADMSAVAAAIRDSLYRYYDTATVNQMFADQSTDFNAALDGIIAYGDEHWGGGGSGNDNIDSVVGRGGYVVSKEITLAARDSTNFYAMRFSNVSGEPHITFGSDFEFLGFGHDLYQAAGAMTDVGRDTIKTSTFGLWNNNWHYLTASLTGGIVTHNFPAFTGDVAIYHGDYVSGDKVAYVGASGFGRTDLDTGKLSYLKNVTSDIQTQLNAKGSGTVSSVGLTMPSAFSVTGSPVTSSGTLTVTGNGTSAQYITGTGALATFAHTHPIADITGLQDSLHALWVAIVAGSGGSSPWSVSGSDVYRSTGKVAIGTSTASATLTVVGDISASTTGSIGTNNTVSGTGTVALGQFNTVSGTAAYAFGYGNSAATTSGRGSAAIGQNNVADNTGIALGYLNNSTGNTSIAIGASNTVTQTYAVAIGDNISMTNAIQGFAVGSSLRNNNYAGVGLLGDNQSTVLNASADKQFSARFANGYRWFTTDVDTVRMAISPGGDVTAFGKLTAKGAVFTAPARLPGYTVATLPTGTVGDIAYVTDASSPTSGAAVVGGGSAVRQVFFDGTNWIIP